MGYRIGVFLQTAALVLLPLVILWELNFEMHLLFVPALLLVGVVIFGIGTKLRS